MSLWLVVIIALLAFYGGFGIGCWWAMRPRLPEDDRDSDLFV